MVTLTMRHHRGQALADLWAGVSKAWAAVTSGRAWVDESRRYAVRGWLRLVEVTVGEAGWHVHVHALMFSEGQSRWSPADLGPLMFQRWAGKLQGLGFRAPLAGHGGLDVRVLTGDAGCLGDYFTKGVYRAQEAAGDTAERLGLEVARGDLKRARGGNRTPFTVLADVVAVGVVDDLALWHEWEQASRGRRQLTWSRGWRAELLAGVVEQTDADIAETDVGGDLVLVLAPRAWSQIRREGLRLLVLGAAESDDDGGDLRALCRERGWAWSVPVLSPVRPL
jgi:hypothetical protein